ncbi:MAG: P1 family peptidase [Firmicutes bacterium]|nr:P1 family peptidase [Bacillota bacterium]
MEKVDIVSMPGIKIGNAEDIESATGCTVIICKDGAVAGVDVRGGAPGTRETDLLNPENLVDKVHGVLLAGGSAFGLDAASGIMEYLEGRGIGFDVGITKVPIVIGAVLFDLEIGNYKIRPDKKMGYEACINSERIQFNDGNVGAGTGASVGKILGIKGAMKGGLGSCCFKIGELCVGALVAVNCLGDVIDPTNNKIIAGALKEDGSFLDSEDFIIKSQGGNHVFAGNTTIGAVITNAILNKAQASKVASMAHNGYARTIKPSHTMYDGDTIFVLSQGKINADISAVGTLAALAVEQAVLNGVKKAKGAYGLKSVSDLF